MCAGFNGLWHCLLVVLLLALAYPLLCRQGWLIVLGLWQVMPAMRVVQGCLGGGIKACNFPQFFPLLAAVFQGVFLDFTANLWPRRHSQHWHKAF